MLHVYFPLFRRIGMSCDYGSKVNFYSSVENINESQQDTVN